MIRYALRCEQGHSFESWFQSSQAFDSQVKRKLVACPACDTTAVEKAIMAPRVVGKRKREQASVPSAPAASLPATVPQPDAASGSQPLMLAQERELRAKLKELRDYIVSNAENVGPRFPNEARRMHYGEIEHRPIYGEASPDDARALLEEGVEVAALPVLPEDRN